jgi:hypothetical protein
VAAAAITEAAIVARTGAVTSTGIE